MLIHTYVYMYIYTHYIYIYIYTHHISIYIYIYIYIYIHISHVLEGILCYTMVRHGYGGHDALPLPDRAAELPVQDGRDSREEAAKALGDSGAR